MRKVILYIAASIDGFIAREDGNIDWLPPINNENNDDYGYKSFYENIDVTLIGRKTYQQILTFPANEFVEFVNDDVYEFVNQLKSQSGKDIWLVGGAQLNKTLLNLGLIDEIILTIIPIVLGKGIHLFGQQSIEQQFKYSDTKIFSSGCVQIKYTI
ncbi:unnamed protein product [Rotaria sp. Silwood1]|nr:unnamed protein product [Rotaria sp. Silwood1]CAF1683067.1 unnamed protein product [Rotaria sp. Silwood1]